MSINKFLNRIKDNIWLVTLLATVLWSFCFWETWILWGRINYLLAEMYLK